MTAVTTGGRDVLRSSRGYCCRGGPRAAPEKKCCPRHHVQGGNNRRYPGRVGPFGIRGGTSGEIAYDVTRTGSYNDCLSADFDLMSNPVKAKITIHHPGGLGILLMRALRQCHLSW